MRRLLAALLASAMLAAPAMASRVMIVVPKKNQATSGMEVTANIQMERNLEVLLSQIDDMGGRGNYVLVPQSIVKTEYARTGLMVWPDGTSEQMAGVICPSYPGSNSQTFFATCRWDSMTRVARGGPLVPHFYALDNVSSLVNSNGYIINSTAASRCSIGVAETTDKCETSGAQSLYMVERPSVRWIPHTYTKAFPVTVTSVVGGLRKLLNLSTNGLALYTYPRQCQWPDSLPFYTASSETTLVWDRQWADIASASTAKTMTFCTWFGAGILSDSVFNTVLTGYTDGKGEGETSVLRFGLAHFDSLIGGVLFNKDPAVRGIVVKNAVSRGLRRWTGGIAPGDTSSFYGGLDSLTAWGVPVTFALNVNPDTLTAYSRDLIKLKSIPQARFTPYITDGVLDTAATLGATGTTRNKARWVDVLGRWRNRVLIGDGGFGDTSLVAQLTYLRTFTDSVTGRPTVRVIVPPYDDWSPGDGTNTNRFVAKRHSRTRTDSVMYAMQQAGFIGVLANGQSDECNLLVNSGPGYTNPRGYIGKQGWYTPSMGTDKFMVLTHWGGTMGLGKEQYSAWGDSSSALSQGTWSYIGATLDRANGQFFNDKWYNSDIWYVTGSNINADFWTTYRDVVWPTIDVLTTPERSHVLQLFASDLSGQCCNPARSGLHVIRSLQQSFYATNLAAGRTLVRLGYLDEVRP